MIWPDSMVSTAWQCATTLTSVAPPPHGWSIPLHTSPTVPVLVCIVAENARAVPLAIDAQNQVTEPDKAVVRGHYRCLACNERVSLVLAHQRVMHGQTIAVRAHFSHHASSTCAATGESIQHLAAKLTVQQEAGRSGVLRFALRCPDCGLNSIRKYVLRPGQGVRAEVQVGSRRLDLAVVDLHTGRVALGIEIRHTHAVTADKADELDLPWFEITTAAGARRVDGGDVCFETANSNCFAYQPCPCGNDAFSHQEARRRADVRREHKRQQARERQLQAARLDAERRSAAVRVARLEQRPVQPAAHTAPTAAQHAAFREQLLAALPDVFDRLLAFTCVLGPCPGCGQQQIFFDPRGMNMVPTWSPYVLREQPAHPWRCRCVACGWHAQAPPDGQVFVLRGNAFGAPAPGRLALPRAAPAPERGFWWQDAD